MAVLGAPRAASPLFVPDNYGMTRTMWLPAPKGGIPWHARKSLKSPHGAERHRMTKGVGELSDLNASESRATKRGMLTRCTTPWRESCRHTHPVGEGWQGMDQPMEVGWRACEEACQFMGNRERRSRKPG